MWASKNGHFPVAQYLLQHGADINRKDMVSTRFVNLFIDTSHSLIYTSYQCGKTALDLARESNQAEIVRLLG